MGVGKRKQEAGSFPWRRAPFPQEPFAASCFPLSVFGFLPIYTTDLPVTSRQTMAMMARISRM